MPEYSVERLPAKNQAAYDSYYPPTRGDKINVDLSKSLESPFTGMSAREAIDSGEA